MDAATGKLLVSAERLRALSERRAALAYAKKKGLPRPELQEVVLTSDAQGASRQDKNRLTWICRQGLFGLWKLPDSNTLPDGVILDSVYLTVCADRAGWRT